MIERSWSAATPPARIFCLGCSVVAFMGDSFRLELLTRHLLVLWWEPTATSAYLMRYIFRSLAVSYFFRPSDISTRNSEVDVAAMVAIAHAIQPNAIFLRHQPRRFNFFH